jgi:glycosidase
MTLGSMRSVQEIDLAPKPGKLYWKSCQREWREEFIYFLLVDRFHDDNKRSPTETQIRHSGFGQPNELRKFCGGTIKGITTHLDYIHNLGCTAVWLSPVFENNLQSYHGYAIQNYLDVDKRFGTKDDLEELVDKAHTLDMRVFLDIVLHHSGDNWYYPNDHPYYYFEGMEFPLGGWRMADRPIPIELRDPKLYNRKGQIRNYERYPETCHGDFMALKSFKSDGSTEALRVQNMLIKIHCYWMREVDIDGFRIDGVKHLGELALSRFCSHIREYAYTLGKRNFFLFGELVGPEDMYNRYIGPMTSTSVDHKTIYFGLNSLLDFHLYQLLPEVIMGTASPEKLIGHYESLGKAESGRGEYGGFLVTFLDNHDQVGQAIKHRFGKDAKPEQIVAGVCFLLCALGTPCIYYGTEQGFDGSGENDHDVREAMFSLHDKTTNLLDANSMIYKGISKMAKVRREYAALRFGRMYICKVSVDGIYFHFPDCPGCLIAFSRVLHDEELLIAYNTSPAETCEEFVTVGNKRFGEFRFIYGGTGKIKVETNSEGNKHFLKLKLNPMQFVILANI